MKHKFSIIQVSSLIKVTAVSNIVPSRNLHKQVYIMAKTQCSLCNALNSVNSRKEGIIIPILKMKNPVDVSRVCHTEGISQKEKSKYHT